MLPASVETVDVADADVVNFKIVNFAGEDYPAIEYPRRKFGAGTGGVDYTADGVTYHVETGTTLVVWSAGHPFVEPFSVIDDGNGITETVEIRSETPISLLPGEFLRLILSAP